MSDPSSNDQSSSRRPITRDSPTHDTLIYEYVQQARNRIEQLAPRTPPSPKRPQLTSQSSQWPLPRASADGPEPVIRRQEDLAPYRDRAPQETQPRVGRPFNGEGGPRNEPRNYAPSQSRDVGSAQDTQMRSGRPLVDSGRPSNAPQMSTPQHLRSSRPGQPFYPPRNFSTIIPPQPRQPPPRSDPSQQAPTHGPRASVRVQHPPMMQGYVPRSNIQEASSSAPSPGTAGPTITRPVGPMARQRPIVSLGGTSVPAIREEAEARNSFHPSMSSVAASDVLGEYYNDSQAETSEDETQGEIHHSQQSSADSGRDLFRQASISKREKPTLMLIRSPSGREKSIEQESEQPFSDPPSRTSAVADSVISPLTPSEPTIPPMAELPAPTSQRNLAGSNVSLATMIPAQLNRASKSPSLRHSQSNESMLSGFSTGQPTPSRSTPLALKAPISRQNSMLDPDVDGVLAPPRSPFARASYASASKGKGPETPAVGTGSNGFATESGTRDSVNSVTSLHGMIQRALRLASNLERGKTSSKFGLDWMTVNSVEEAKAKRRQSGSTLKSMLDSFPETPGIGNDRPGRGQVALSRWQTNGQSALRHSRAMSPIPSTPRGPTEKERRRRCCFMPLWVFILLCIALILLVVAAVIVPIVLVVLPKDHSSPHSSSASNALAACAKSNPCMNGGSSVLSPTNTCECLCVNGWSGPTCTARDSSGCVTSNLGATNTTVGSAIPRVINLAQPEFAISLNATTLYADFITSELSCSSQNALVTFNGLSSRDVMDTSLHAILHRRAIPELEPRQATQTVTNNGIVYAASAGPSSSPSATAASSASAASSATPTSTGAFDATSQRNLDFSRVAVLYILQSSADLDTAVSAQGALQNYIQAPGTGDPANVGLGSGWTANLIAETVAQS